MTWAVVCFIRSTLSTELKITRKSKGGGIMETGAPAVVKARDDGGKWQGKR